MAGVAFMGMSAALTCTVHFAILTLGRQPAFVSLPWARQVFAFEWPSVAYALDILGRDVFFALGAVFAAATVEGPGAARLARRLLQASAVLFPAAAGVLAVLFRRDGAAAPRLPQCAC